MVVVVDSSPLNYLLLIHAIQILPRLFGQVLIPEAVSGELQSTGTPPKVVARMSRSPSWLRIEKAVLLDDENLEKLGAGEREAIALAFANGSGVLLLMTKAEGGERPSNAESAAPQR